MARQVPGVRRLEYDGRGGRRAGDDRERASARAFRCGSAAPDRRSGDGGLASLPDRLGGAGQGTWGRRDSRLDGADRRRSRRGQVEPDASRVRRCGAARAARAVCDGRGIDAADPHARRPSRRGGRRSLRRQRDESRHDCTAYRENQAGASRHRLDPDDFPAGDRECAGQREPGAGVQRGAPADCESGGNRRFRHRTCHEGRKSRRSAGLGAYRGYGALFRGGEERGLSRAPRDQESLRQHERDRAV